MASLRDRVSVEFRDHLAIVSLDRTEKYNALDLSMMQALVEAARLVRRRRDVRVVILRGEGKAFCAGLDFASVTRQPMSVLRAFLPWFRKANLFSASQSGLARSSNAGDCGHSRLLLRRRVSDRAGLRFPVQHARLRVLDHGNRLGADTRHGCLGHAA